MNRKLIVNADDFGLTEKVNEGILLAHRNGIVTSASLMANGAAFESAARMACQESGLDCGLHLNLTEGFPVAQPSTIPSLADTKGFIYHHPKALWLALWQRKVRVADVEVEIRAQLQKVMAAGVAISHIDGHKHVHVMPPIFGAVARTARAHGIKAIRSTIESSPGFVSLLRRNMPAGRQIVKQYVSAKVLSGACRASMFKGLPDGLFTPRRLCGLTHTGFLDLEALACIVRRLPEGVSELMCHPGQVDSDLRKTTTRLLFQREKELDLLTGVATRKLIEDEKIQLVGYKDLVRDNGSCDPNALLHRRSAV